MASLVFWIVMQLCFGVVILRASSHQCLVTKNNIGLPNFPGYPTGYGGSGEEITPHQQAMFTSYTFECCGNITAWGVDVNPGYQFQRYILDLQVWRPAPTVNSSDGTGCYSLVGSNRFNATSHNIVPPGVVVVTPSPHEFVPFQPGDILGVYVEEALSSSDGIVMLATSRFTSELVWYASIAPALATSQNRDCPYSVGGGGVLNSSIYAAPVISLATANYPCSVTSTPGPKAFGPSVGNNYSITLAIGAVAVILIIINIFTVFMSVIICLKKKRTEARTDERGSVYDYPAMGQNDNNMILMRNKAYAVTPQETITIKE